MCFKIKDYTNGNQLGNTNQDTCSGPFGGTGILILVPVVLGGLVIFLSSDVFSELEIWPCPLLSPGLCQCTEALSSCPLVGDFGFPSLGIHLFSSYLEECATISMNKKNVTLSW